MTGSRLDALPLCPALRGLPPGDVADDERREEDGLAGLGACLAPSVAGPLGRLVCASGHVWTAARHEALRLAPDPVGALWRDAAEQAAAWRRAFLANPLRFHGLDPVDSAHDVGVTSPPADHKSEEPAAPIFGEGGTASSRNETDANPKTPSRASMRAPGAGAGPKGTHARGASAGNRRTSSELASLGGRGAR